MIHTKHVFNSLVIRYKMKIQYHRLSRVTFFFYLKQNPKYALSSRIHRNSTGSISFQFIIPKNVNRMLIKFELSSLISILKNSPSNSSRTKLRILIQDERSFDMNKKHFPLWKNIPPSIGSWRMKHISSRTCCFCQNWLEIQAIRQNYVI